LAQARLHEELRARAQSTREGRKHPQEAAELAFSQPATQFKLLVEQYRADLGKDTALPASALAVEAAKKKEAPPLDAAIADLKAALIAHMQVPDAELDKLGKDRATAIQDALLSGKQIDPGRVFVVNAAPKPDSGDKVKVELSVR
ncbi:MAG: hypothetical protein ACRETP_15265, partial [Steroidobacteraceae bacterium]